MFYRVLLQFERSKTGLQRRGLYINTAPAVCIARRPSYVERMKLPGMYAVQRVGDRWLVVSVNEWSLAAGRTFERREMRAADVALAPPCPRPEKPAQRSNSELMVSRRRFARDQLPQAATYLRTGPRRD